jgi:hypothetical protein
MCSPLRIELRVSRALRASLLALAVLAGVALWLTALPRWSLLALPLLLAGAWPRVRGGGWRALVLRSDGSAAALDADGAETDVVPCRLQRRGVLTVLTLEAQGRMQTHLFTPETLDAEASRRLGLWYARHAARRGDAAGAVPHV